MNDNKNRNIKRNNITLFQKNGIKTEESLKKINHNNINKIYNQEIKSFFKKYLSKKKKKKTNEQNKVNINNEDVKSQSESDSNSQNIAELNYHELNNLYLRCYENLKQFYDLNKDIKGLRLEGNKILEEISFEQFNELFLEYGKASKKNLKSMY